MIIRENIPLASLTTMRLGGPARYVIEIESESDIEPAFDFARSHNLPFFILGGGANTIAHDEGFNGVIIKNAMQSIEILEGAEETKGQKDPFERPLWTGDGAGETPARAQSRVREAATAGPVQIAIMGGTIWDDAVAFACAHGLTGIEALSKIPGLAGAAPVQNIGAYGQDISDTFISARVYDTKTHEFKILSATDFHFSYRHSIMNTTEQNRYFVISVTFSLHHGQMSRPFYNSVESYIAAHNITDFSPASIRQIVSAIRADKLPDPTTKPSAGSFFKNIYLTEEEAAVAESKGYPVYRGHDGLKINSGWLIESCGLKGQLLHGFRINPKSALVLINESATSYNDLVAARTEIINQVKAKFGYTLEQEPIEL